MPFKGRSLAVKRKALAALRAGDSAIKVSRMIGCTPQTLYRWKADAHNIEDRATMALADGDEDMTGRSEPDAMDDSLEAREEASDWTGNAFGGMTPEGAVTVSVLRENDRVAGTWAWCEDVAAQSFNLTSVRQRWGAGTYRFLVRDRAGKQIEIRTLPIAAPPQDQAQSPSPNGNGSPVSGLMDQVMHAMLLRALDPPSVWDKIAQAMPILAPVIGQVIANRPAQADPVAIATAITNAASAMRGAGGPSGSPDVASELIKTFRDGLSLGQTLTSDREPGMVDVARELGPGLLSVLTQKNGAPQQAPVAVIPPRANGNGHAPAPPSQPQQTVSPMWAALIPSLDALAPIIIDGAQRGEPVSDLAERIYAATPAYMQSVIEHASLTPGAIDVVMSRYSALAPHREYVAQLLTELGKPAPAEDVVE